MKKLTKRVASLLSIGSAAFLGLFHTSCDRLGGGGRVEYGSPYVEYEVKAKVQSPEGKPIEGIEVTLLEKSNYAEDGFVSWTKIQQTDANGVAQIFDDASAFGRNMLYVRAVDADGAKNGRWETKVDSVAITPADIHKDKSKGHWYEGTIKKEVTLTMAPVPKEDTPK
ncbi:radical SAM-associated putative lipoprotein [Porphyromonas sp.]